MPRLSWSIDVGHVITIVVTAAALIAFAVRLEARVNWIDENGPKITRALQDQLHNVQTELAVSRTENKNLLEKIEKLDSKLEKLLDKRL
jgi:hypothetical protein